MKISIIVTNFNYSKFLDRAIRSAFVQNYPTDKFELIVVDDCSTDKSLEIIESYGDLISKIYLKDNVGLSKARNIGVEKSNGEYIIFIDADDFIHRDLIFIAGIFLDQNEMFDAVSVDYITVDEKGHEIKRVAFSDNPLACGIMYRKEKFINIGMFDENLRVNEDKEFRERFNEKGYKMHNIELPLYRYRKHRESLTYNNDDKNNKIRL